MNRITTATFNLFAFVVLTSAFAATAFAQTASPTPTPPPQNNNPFAPQPAPPLPEGMTGSDVNDPRYKLSPGVYNAGETSMGLKHLLLAKKPEAFDLGTNDPSDPKVNASLKTVLGIGQPEQMQGPMKLVLAGLGFAKPGGLGRLARPGV